MCAETYYLDGRGVSKLHIHVQGALALISIWCFLCMGCQLCLRLASALQFRQLEVCQHRLGLVPET